MVVQKLAMLAKQLWVMAHVLRNTQCALRLMARLMN